LVFAAVLAVFLATGFFAAVVFVVYFADSGLFAATRSSFVADSHLSG
jgi:hypothetical protein